MLSKYLNEEISFKDFSKHVIENKDVNLALNFYKLFGHVGTFDELFLGTGFEYMLMFPQIYFAKTSTAIHLKENIKFNSSIYDENILEPFCTNFKKNLSNGTKIFINKDGNFTIRSSDFKFVAKHNGKIYSPSKDVFKIKLSKYDKN